MAHVTFGQWLLDARKSHGYSQGRLSEATGIDRTYIGRMEKGAVKLPEDSTRAKFHAVFGTTDDQLVEAGVMVRQTYMRADGGETVVYEAAPQPEPAIHEDVSDYAALPAHLRTSFLKLGRLTPERRALVERLIDELDTEAEAQRQELQREEE